MGAKGCKSNTEPPWPTPSATPRHHMPRPSRIVPGPRTRPSGQNMCTDASPPKAPPPTSTTLHSWKQQWCRWHSEATACSRISQSYSTLGAQGACGHFRDRWVTVNAPCRSSTPPNALPRAPLAHPRNCTRPLPIPATHSSSTLLIPRRLRKNDFDADTEAALKTAWGNSTYTQTNNPILLHS